jgi:preprotein translocase subunit SecF
MAAKDSKDTHNFRYLLKPGHDFAFMSKAKVVVLLSLLAIAASIGALFVNKAVRGDYMNWTIDFKGGTEIIYSFKDKSAPPGEVRYVTADSSKVRKALKDAGAAGFDVSDRSWTDEVKGKPVTVKGILVRTPRFGATTPKQQQAASELFAAKFEEDREVDKMQWSGDRLFVRSKKPIMEAEAADIWTKAGLEAKPWGEVASSYTTPDEGTGEYNITFSMYGLDRQYETVLEKEIPGIDADVVQTSQVSAKAGTELRNDGIKALFFALMLIMIYLAIRFDIRYAPGAAFATLHDAVVVVGVFAVTWTDVSLTSIAALLTVIGYSVNDTVVVFDRIRENSEKLKDKKLERIIDISMNEVLARSILTALTVFVTTLMMNLFGEGLIRNFAFAMNIGVIVGAYSSIFLAAPLFLWISKKWYSGPAPARARQAAALASEP